jgi:response regulator RpfG family c-di-GMP phosphodiesterase
MIDELKTLEPQLKQILYGCVEHVQATKAALYLSVSHDLNEKTYEIVASYQFNDTTRKVVRSADDLVDRLAVKRNAFFVNGLGSDMRFSEILFRQGTDRILAAPLFARGRLVGFIDMRDKAGRKPFETPDLDAARAIGEQVVSLLGTNKLFGLAPIPLSDPPEPAPRASAAAPMMPISAHPTPPVVAERRFALSAEALRSVEAARDYLSKRQHAAGTAKHVLNDADLEVVRLLLPAALAIPGAVLACFSAIGHVNNPQAIVAIATVTEDAMEMLQSHLQNWLKRSSQAPMTTTKTQLIYPFGVQVVPVSAAGISTILSAPVNPQTFDGLVLTVAFERTPEAQAQRALQIFLRQIEQSVESAIAAGGGRSDRYLLAEKLLEPDFQRYPDLAEHCRTVSALAHRFAETLELSPAQAETVKIAALLHDVGLRLLDYERLYRRPSLTAEELRGLAEHPIVGAALVEPLLGTEVAQAVLRHHERVDGKGYPSRLGGTAIPLASRIIQICDAWVAMTSRRSYQPAIEAEAARRALREGAGTQFDPALVERFLRFEEAVLSPES